MDIAGVSSPSLDSAVHNLNNLNSEVVVPQHTTSRIHDYHPHENIIGDPDVGVQMRHQVSNALSCFTPNSKIFRTEYRSPVLFVKR